MELFKKQRFREYESYAEHLGVFDDFKVILNNGFAKHITLSSLRFECPSDYGIF